MVEFVVVEFVAVELVVVEFVVALACMEFELGFRKGLQEYLEHQERLDCLVRL